MAVVGDRPIYFAHIPRSGGTSVTTWVTSHLADREKYPAGDPSSQLSQKMYPAGLRALSDAQQQTIRFYAPHLPVSAHELLDVKPALFVLVREPLDQLRSSLDLQDPDADLRARFEHAPNRWYATNQLGWYLGADVDDVVEVFDRIVGLPSDQIGDALQAALTEVMGGRSLVDAACRRLEEIDLLALSHARGGAMVALAEWLGVAPPDLAARRNEGRGTELPADLRDWLHELTESDRAIYDHAVKLVS